MKPSSPWAGVWAGHFRGEVQILHVLESSPRLSDRNSGGHDALSHIGKAVPEVIAELVRLSQTNILVIGSVSRSQLRQSAASTAAQVLAQVSCDVLVMKPLGFGSPVLIADR
jgi:hypothetical protein